MKTAYPAVCWIGDQGQIQTVLARALRADWLTIEALEPIPERAQVWLEFYQRASSSDAWHLVRIQGIVGHSKRLRVSAADDSANRYQMTVRLLTGSGLRRRAASEPGRSLRLFER